MLNNTKYKMKYICVFSAFLITMIWNSSFANNLQITNVTATTSSIQFNISWENSWFTNNPPNNWDAVWIFIKAQDCESFDKAWKHVDVSTTASEHSAAGLLTVNSVTDGKGVFVRRSSFGFGTIPSTSVNIKLQGTYNLANVNFEVMGIEMVAVLGGAFEVGGSGTNGFASNNITAQPYNITSESAISTAALKHTNQGSSHATYNPSIPAGYPKGFNKFYMMKYEISQEQYVAFLNLLNFTQQTARTEHIPNSAIGSNALATHLTNVSNRNGIRIQTPGNVTTPAIYGCNLNNNATFNEVADGQNIACNFLKWTDLLAYLDWAALRPMTELEYEKAARGFDTQVNNAYAWGNTSITAAVANATSGSGTGNELSTAALTPGSGLCAHGIGSTSTIYGPLRVGFAATQTTDRAGAGASYWGVMELSGNVWEQAYSVGYANGNIAPFTGLLGNGELSPVGEANQTGWSLDPSHSIVRGGSYYSSTAHCQISNRNYISSNSLNLNRDKETGGRGVRQF